jgi:hypothetical protein
MTRTRRGGGDRARVGWSLMKWARDYEAIGSHISLIARSVALA